MQDPDTNFPVDEDTAPCAGAGSPGRRRRIAALAALAAVLVLPPLVAYAAFGRDLDKSGQVLISGQSTPDGGYGANAPDPDPPSAAPTRTPSGTTQQPWQVVDLAGATLTLDAWRPSPAGSPPCPTGKVTFTSDSAAVPGKATVRLRQNALVDVDHDGSYEIAVVLFCQDTPAGTYQAIVLKSAAGGSLTTMGQLARSGPTGEDILAVAPGAGGLINLTVGNIIPCCGTPRSLELTQIRTFAWKWSGFTQVAGPTTFVADRSATTLNISAPAVHLTGLIAGKSSGTLTVTIRDQGPRDARQVSVAVWPDQPLAPGVGGDWAKCVTLDGTNRALVCPVGNLAVGASATLTLPLTGLFGSQAITLEARIGNQVYDTVTVPSYYG
jgi:hypothetical protein